VRVLDHFVAGRNEIVSFAERAMHSECLQA